MAECILCKEKFESGKYYVSTSVYHKETEYEVCPKCRSLVKLGKVTEEILAKYPYSEGPMDCDNAVREAIEYGKWALAQEIREQI